MCIENNNTNLVTLIFLANLFFLARCADEQLFKVICVILVEQICLGSGFLKSVAQTQVNTEINMSGEIQVFLQFVFMVNISYYLYFHMKRLFISFFLSYKAN